MDDSFFRSLVDHANDTIVSFDNTGTIWHINAACQRLLGLTPGVIIGTNLIDYLHPDDVDRAMYLISQYGRHPRGLSNGSFRLRHVDGSWVPTDITTGGALDGQRPLLVAHCRYSTTPQMERQVLIGLLNAVDLVEVMSSVLDAISWKEIGSQIAIAWTDGHAWRHVDTGLPAPLAGRHDAPPWSDALTSGNAVSRTDLDGLDDAARSTATSLGFGGYWIEPIRTPGTNIMALITIWTLAGRAEPRIHEYGMTTAKSYVDVILRFTSQRRQLDHAATHDPLTGLANRQHLDRVLASEHHAGALVYCDLDRFKPVNDLFGHATGDELLSRVANRLCACVRAGDLIARIGGDEFVVVCPELDREHTGHLARRLIEVLDEPFVIEGNVIEIGVSIGMVCSDKLSTASIGRADRAMFEAKAAGRNTCWWAEPE